ncbi:MAG: OmpA family protein [Enhygromyxa sp.]
MTPFVLVGAGGLGVASPRELLGSDIDPALHFGGGVEISGHTDNKGDHDRNVDLSRRRAESVKRYLVEHGVDEARIETVGHGPDKPIDSNDTKAGRANNRRIEFEIIRRAR